MTETTTRTGPITVDVEAGKKYFWCTCGKTQTPPFCDGNHTGTSMVPVKWTAERNETVHFCACHRTGTAPMCDGTHDRE